MKLIDTAIVVNEAVAEVLYIKLCEVIEDSTLTDLGADSIDLVNISISLEDSYSISVDDDCIKGSMKVKKLQAYIRNLVEPK